MLMMSLFTSAGCTPYTGLCCIHFLSLVLFFFSLVTVCISSHLGRAKEATSKTNRISSIDSKKLCNTTSRCSKLHDCSGRPPWDDDTWEQKEIHLWKIQKTWVQPGTRMYERGRGRLWGMSCRKAKRGGGWSMNGVCVRVRGRERQSKVKKEEEARPTKIIWGEGRIHTHSPDFIWKLNSQSKVKEVERLR